MAERRGRRSLHWCDGNNSERQNIKMRLTFPLRGRGTTQWWMRCLRYINFNAFSTSSAIFRLWQPLISRLRRQLPPVGGSLADCFNFPFYRYNINNRHMRNAQERSLHLRVILNEVKDPLYG